MTECPQSCRLTYESHEGAWKHLTFFSIFIWCIGSDIDNRRTQYCLELSPNDIDLGGEAACMYQQTFHVARRDGWHASRTPKMLSTTDLSFYAKRESLKCPFCAGLVSTPQEDRIATTLLGERPWKLERLFALNSISTTFDDVALKIRYLSRAK